MFLGQYRHQIDAKGRIAVPAQYRKGFGPGSVVVFGPEGRLMMLPTAEWDEMAARFRRNAATPAEERVYIRQLFSSARELEVDAQGRMLLTPDQRRFAAVGERAVFVGMGNCVEVVGEQRWDGEVAQLSADDFTALHDRVNVPLGENEANT